MNAKDLYQQAEALEIEADALARQIAEKRLAAKRLRREAERTTSETADDVTQLRRKE